MRGSDVDATLYWFARMLDGGKTHVIWPAAWSEWPRKMWVCQTLRRSPSPWLRETYERLGSPEGELALAEAMVYLATAPKSNAVYVAYKVAMAAKQTGSLMPLQHILNAPTKLMKAEGYARAINMIMTPKMRFRDRTTPGRDAARAS